MFRAAVLGLVLAAAGCAWPMASASQAPPAATETAAVPGSETGAGGALRAEPERLVGAPPARPTMEPMAPRFGPDLVAAYCLDRDDPPPETHDPALTILDRTHSLAADDAPDDLVAASAAGLEGISALQQVRQVVIDDLAAMAAAWKAEGLTIEIESAYRSYADQAATFEDWVSRIGEEAARARAARPGHSEHQLGTAIDVVSPGWSGRFGDWATESAEGAWMAEHAWEFGFVMSYPAGGLADTCYGYEPWHYRWIGRDAAAAHRASGLTLRAFLERSAAP
jgi:D-alanyl-D-alanine carboxypeptidase